MPTISVPAVATLKDIKVFRPFPNATPWRDGKLRGAIKSGNDKYHVAETMLNQFRDGESCEVEFKTFGGGEGKEPGREVVKKIGGMGPQQSKQFTRPAATPRESEQIWCTAHSKKILPALYDPSLGLDEESSIKLIEALRRVYARTFGGTIAQTRDDMNDSVGF